ncbi:MAG: GNAT family N-acetyltransferase [Candidatus Coatesbacteria bacterium]|nr:MAG: GNAT family N-acetyltransferase [Candidatus Coatesbacteria bacterium]
MAEIKRLRSGDEGLAREIVGNFYPDGTLNEGFLSDGRNYLLAAYVNGELAGFLYAYELPRLDRPEPMMFLYSIDVLPEYREKGVGKKLIEELKFICVERGFMKMYVITGEENEAAMRLYESAGGRRCADDDIVFVWEFKA